MQSAFLGWMLRCEATRTAFEEDPGDKEGRARTVPPGRLAEMQAVYELAERAGLLAPAARVLDDGMLWDHTCNVHLATQVEGATELSANEQQVEALFERVRRTDAVEVDTASDSDSSEDDDDRATERARRRGEADPGGADGEEPGEAKGKLPKRWKLDRRLGLDLEKEGRRLLADYATQRRDEVRRADKRRQQQDFAMQAARERAVQQAATLRELSALMGDFTS